MVVYREVFETILFYAAIWTQGGHAGMLAGALTAVAILAVVAWAMLAYSKRLPIGRFFSLSSILMAILSVVLIGKGWRRYRRPAGSMSIRSPGSPASKSSASIRRSREWPSNWSRSPFS